MHDECGFDRVDGRAGLLFLYRSLYYPPSQRLRWHIPLHAFTHPGLNSHMPCSPDADLCRRPIAPPSPLYVCIPYKRCTQGLHIRSVDNVRWHDYSLGALKISMFDMMQTSFRAGRTHEGSARRQPNRALWWIGVNGPYLVENA